MSVITDSAGGTETLVLFKGKVGGYNISETGATAKTTSLVATIVDITTNGLDAVPKIQDAVRDGDLQAATKFYVDEAAEFSKTNIYVNTSGDAVATPTTNITKPNKTIMAKGKLRFFIFSFPLLDLLIHLYKDIKFLIQSY